jgi:hypothetical protein
MIGKLDAFGGFAAKSIQFSVFLPLLSRTWGRVLDFPRKNGHKKCPDGVD